MYPERKIPIADTKYTYPLPRPNCPNIDRRKGVPDKIVDSVKLATNITISENSKGRTLFSAYSPFFKIQIDRQLRPKHATKIFGVVNESSIKGKPARDATITVSRCI